MRPFLPSKLPVTLAAALLLATPFSAYAQSLSSHWPMPTPTGDVPATKPVKGEFGLRVDATGDYNQKLGNFEPYQTYRTRVLEQLTDFKPTPVPLDKYGGRLDKTEKATGFYHVARIGGRWWAIDPEGHYFINMAVVNVSPSTSDRGQAALAKKFGNQAAWMRDTQALLLKNGFNSAGSWSAATLIASGEMQKTQPISYSVNFDIMAAFRSTQGRASTATGFPGDTIYVYDPAFEPFARKYITEKVAGMKTDPNLFGYFSDNEIPLGRNNLDGYLTLPATDPGHVAAAKFLADHDSKHPTDDLRVLFLRQTAERYFKIVSGIIRAADPNHMYLGCRFHSFQEKQFDELFEVIGKYADVVSVNNYHTWTPDAGRQQTWVNLSGRPAMITEWYAKSEDSGLSNTTGAGWLVHKQADRGAFYQNYTLGLLEQGNTIGWQWFQYQDNDPSNANVDSSNKDSNKGIVTGVYEPYAVLLERMRQINTNAYQLADYFDARRQRK